MANLISCHLKNPHFDNIASGKKTVELRLWSPTSKFANLELFSNIEFVSNENTPKKITKKVSGFRWFPTFREALIDIGYKKCIPNASNIDDAHQVYMDIPGYREGQFDTGIIAIFLM